MFENLLRLTQLVNGSARIATKVQPAPGSVSNHYATYRGGRQHGGRQQDQRSRQREYVQRS